MNALIVIGLIAVGLVVIAVFKLFSSAGGSRRPGFSADGADYSMAHAGSDSGGDSGEGGGCGDGGGGDGGGD